MKHLLIYIHEINFIKGYVSFFIIFVLINSSVEL